MSTLEYLRDPDEIYRRSFEIVRAETDLSHLPAELHEVAIRIVHACGVPDLVADLEWRGEPVAAGRAALARAAPVLADCRMVAEGIIRRRLPAANAVRCFVGEPEAAAGARRARTTRSAAAVDLWRPHLDGALVAIGNAPTALFRLLEILGEATAPRPRRHPRLPGRVRGRGGIEARARTPARSSALPHPARPPRRQRGGGRGAQRDRGERELDRPGSGVAAARSCSGLRQRMSADRRSDGRGLSPFETCAWAGNRTPRVAL